ncbi:glycine receptor subunit alpha-3-like [Argiope bruennichi]|uniref:Glycine receptor subunit alphaZ1 like protein n=1 Tax=Argiope bruennichi TaxID=94029 RepID=A0A8T0FJA7_ARGBR|nr:glycine receptor subunit alpha-3-like [Argiope bruennichi]KAF8790542.1 Glycine receptor subunit alphaZ1 like protein [Argiope bruennichi]
MGFLLTCALVYIIFSTTVLSATETFRPNSTIDDLNLLDALLKNYDRRALPTSHKGTPTEVRCEMYIRSFGSINPSTMDYEVDLYLRQKWLDERLRKPEMSRPLDLNDPKLVQRIWKPEVFFANAKHAEFQYVTVPNVLVRITPSGHLLYMLRLKLTFSCMMDLYRFPLDTQVCTIELASFSKTTSELNLKWSEENPVNLFEKLKLPQFEIKSVNTSLCSEKFHIGEYSCLKAEFNLQRSIGFHLVQSYLPTILIVVISWVSFWLDVEAIPARITLGVTTLLTISSKSSGIQSNLPPVSYVKAIDVWMGACTTFVFTALLEFTLVNYLWRKRRATPPSIKVADENISLRMYEEKEECNGTKKVTKIQQESDDDEPVEEKNNPRVKPYGGTHKISAKRIDQLCRAGFPILFLIFNICYWPYYLF